jgi:sterol desaturase/sphingolipid hydroxylase (fatty acid hydroxylase superfamily)
VDNTPEAVSEALRINPEAAVKLAEIEANNKQALEALRVKEIELELAAQTQAISNVNKTMQAEATSEHWPTYTWRPSIGFAVAFNITLSSLLVLVAFLSSLYGHPEMLAVLPAVLGALAAINTSALPILGIASWFRGKAQADPNVPFNDKG